MKKIICIALALICLAFCFASCSAPAEYEEKYVLYIGYVDKTDAELAAIKAQIDELCVSDVGAYTFYLGEGGWTDDKGSFIAEDTFIYSFNFAKKSDIAALANKIIEKIPGTSILFETQYTSAVHSSSDKFPK